MHILFLTDNFPPETNAPANRIQDHAVEWVREGHRVTVITCAPNFPLGRVFPGYRNRLFQREQVEGIEVIRVWSYMTANEGFLKRTLDYVSFMVSAIFASFAVRGPNVVVATSPQFFCAVGGWIVSALKRRPFVFEIRDLWPETIVAVSAIDAGWLIRGLERFARFLYRQADLLVPVTQSFADHVSEAGVPEDRICIVTNGIDASAVEVTAGRDAVRRRYGIPADAFVAGYVGTIGLCHGLSTLVEVAERFKDDPGLHFAVMGEGADKARMKEIVRERGLKNVTLIDGKPRQEALDLVGSVDVALVMLKDSPVFQTVIPSKIFEAMALRKPIVLGVGGEARRIVVEQCEAGVFFPPEDAEALAARLQELRDDEDLGTRLGEQGRRAVETHYRRADLAKKMSAAMEKRFGE